MGVFVHGGLPVALAKPDVPPRAQIRYCGCCVAVQQIAGSNPFRMLSIANALKSMMTIRGEHSVGHAS